MKIVYVDLANGDDSNPGTLESPMASPQAAYERWHEVKGVEIRILSPQVITSGNYQWTYEPITEKDIELSRQIQNRLFLDKEEKVELQIELQKELAELARMYGEESDILNLYNELKIYRVKYETLKELYSKCIGIINSLEKSHLILEQERYSHRDELVALKKETNRLSEIVQELTSFECGPDAKKRGE